MVIELTDQNFEKIIGDNAQPAVIDFAAAWCGPCKLVSPLIDALADEYDGQVMIGKVDVDANRELALKYGVRNMPTVLYLKNGEVVNRQVGATSKGVLEEKLKAML